MGFYSEINYKGGHPEIPYTTKVIMTINSKGIQLSHFNNFKKKEIFIPKEKIVNVDLEEKTSRSAGKAAAGAIIGGVLTGGIGLLAGGALGARKKDQSKIYLTINYGDRDCVLILETGKKTDNVYSEIVGLFSLQ